MKKKLPRKTPSAAPERRVSLSITGASGARYGIELLRALVDRGFHVDLLISDAGFRVLALEEGLPASGPKLLQRLSLPVSRVQLHDVRNIASRLASGSALRSLAGGIVCPASMGTCARIAHGLSSNLIERHADVLIKEKIPLVVVPREMPLSTLHLENLLKLSQYGCTVLPASPGFYHGPESVNDLVLHVVGKILDALRVDHDLYARWEGRPARS